MKKYFEYAGLLFLSIISFYYTDKMVNYMNKKDPIMKDIENNKDYYKKNCIEGYITSDGAVLSTSGREVNVYESYSNMQGEMYNPDKLVFNDITCKVNADSIQDEFIISASKDKKAVSLFVILDDIDNFKKIKNVFDKYSIKMNVLVNGKILSNNYKYVENLFNEGNEINYLDGGSEDFKLFLKYYSKLGGIAYCATYGSSNMDYCYENGFKKIKTNYYYSNEIYVNTIKNIDYGSFYIYKSSFSTIKDIELVINYLSAKGIKIELISDLFR